MIVYKMSFFMFPLAFVVWAIDALLLLIVVRLACDRMMITTTAPAWRQGLAALTDPFVGRMRQWLRRLGCAHVSNRGAWMIVIAVLVIARCALVSLLVAVS